MISDELETTDELEEETAASLDIETPDKAADSDARPAATLPAPVLFDADARQLVPVQLELDGSTYELALTLAPATDKVLAAYARRCAEASAEGEEDSRETFGARVGAALDATVTLFDRLAEGLDGVGEEGEEAPEGWRDIFGATDKSAVIDAAVFGVTPVEPAAAPKGARPAWGAALNNATVRMKVYFSGREVDVSHTLKKADAKAYGSYVTLMQNVFAHARGADAHMLKLAAGYDALHVSHEGYAGRVPVHHKAAAYVTHMSRQGRALRKN